MKVLATYPSSSSCMAYEVRQGDDGVVYCTCPGWRFHSRRWCKHLEAYSHKHYLGFKEASFKEAIVKGDPIDLVTEDVIRLLKGGYND